MLDCVSNITLLTSASKQRLAEMPCTHGRLAMPLLGQYSQAGIVCSLLIGEFSMSDVIKSALSSLIQGERPGPKSIRACFQEIMNGDISEAQMAAFLIALRMRGEQVADIAAAATVMREKATTITATDAAMDIVGTGGDGFGTYNISTASAFVVAGCGIAVAKHGNRAVSSQSGAADVLSALGIELDCDFELVKQALEEANIAFLMAPRHHAAMRHVAPVRAALGVRTIFNMLGPLANPALVKRIMVGVYDRTYCSPFAHVLAELGTTHAWVVHGADGLDEVSTTGPTYVAELKNGTVTEFTISPEDIGLPTVTLDVLRGGDGAHNAHYLRALLNGETGPYRDIVLFNAAAALVASGHEKNLHDAAKRATASIDDGHGRAALDKLVAITNS
jgi:anthranilate phosphoribosyltransferase